MSKRTPYEVRKGILLLLKENSSLTYTQIQTKLSTNYDSVRKNCQELAEYDQVEIKKQEKHAKNGRPYYSVKLTKKGFESLDRKK